MDASAIQREALLHEAGVLLDGELRAGDSLRDAAVRLLATCLLEARCLDRLTLPHPATAADRALPHLVALRQLDVGHHWHATLRWWDPGTGHTAGAWRSATVGGASPREALLAAEEVRRTHQNALPRTSR